MCERGPAYVAGARVGTAADPDEVVPCSPQTPGSHPAGGRHSPVGLGLLGILVSSSAPPPQRFRPLRSLRCTVNVLEALHVLFLLSGGLPRCPRGSVRGVFAHMSPPPRPCLPSPVPCCALQSSDHPWDTVRATSALERCLSPSRLAAPWEDIVRGCLPCSHLRPVPRTIPAHGRGSGSYGA